MDFFTLYLCDIIWVLPGHSMIVAREEMPPENFSFEGVSKLVSPVRIVLRRNSVDLSSVISAIERTEKKSHYRLIGQVNESLKEVIKVIKRLCQKSNDKETCIKNGENTLNGLFDRIKRERQERTRYPYPYRDNSHLKEDLENMPIMNEFIPDCNVKHSCDNWTFLESIVPASEVQYKKIYQALKKQNHPFKRPACL